MRRSSLCLFHILYPSDIVKRVQDEGQIDVFVSRVIGRTHQQTEREGLFAKRVGKKEGTNNAVKSVQWCNEEGATGRGEWRGSVCT